MAKILLIETSTEVCSVAVSADGKVVAETEQAPCPSHAAALTLQIESCMATAGFGLDELDAVAVSKGPGSYTSLRVGASVAKGICYALGKPLIAVDTLYALALAARDARHGPSDALYLPMLDARRNEVWLAAYSASLAPVLLAQPFVFENNSLRDLLVPLAKEYAEKRLVLSGNGAFKVPSSALSGQTEISDIKKSEASFLEKSAIESFQKSDFQDVAYFEPFYMKPPNITEAVKKI